MTLPLHDLPGAHDPYSADTPLADLADDPAAWAMLERLSPGLTQAPAVFGGGPLPTGLLRVMTPRTRLAGTGPEASALLRALDAALAPLAPSAEALQRRSARYDHETPPMPAQAPRPALLVFDKVNGFRDAPSVDAARAALTTLAQRQGWHAEFSAHGGLIHPQHLARFDAVVWNNVSGDVLTLSQRAALRQWIESGGGFVALHGAGGDFHCPWDWYADTLIGARFAGHPMNPVFQRARVQVEPGSALTAGLGSGWEMLEEWYSFTRSPRRTGAEVLLTLDESSYDPTGLAGQDLRMGDHPLAWTRRVGAGRAFYTAIGHRPESYVHPQAAALMARGVAWAMGQPLPTLESLA